MLWLTINREEKRNAISAAVLAGLSDGLAFANRDRDLRAVVITGAGTRAFCAGADLHSGTSFKFDYSEPYAGFANLLLVKLLEAKVAYSNVIRTRNKDTEAALLSLTFVALARIYEFSDDNDYAIKLYDEAIKLDDVAGGAFRDAIAGKQKLLKKQ